MSDYQPLYIDDPDAERRTFFFPQLVLSNDGNPAPAEAGNFPTFYTWDPTANGGNGAYVSQGNTAGPLVNVNATFGLYSVQLSRAQTAGLRTGQKVRIMYDSNNTLPEDVVLIAEILPWLDDGVAQAAGQSVNVSRLAATAPAYSIVGAQLYPYVGTGKGQPARDIVAYNTVTKDATVSVPWDVAFDATTKYQVTVGSRGASVRDDVLGAPDAVLATYPAGSPGEKLRRLAMDSGGNVGVGSLVQAALGAISTQLERGGGALDVLLTRITASVATMLGRLVGSVNNAGAITTQNPGGLLADERVAVLNASGDTDALMARLTQPLADKLALLAVNQSGYVTVSNGGQSSLTQQEHDALLAASTNSDTLLQRVTSTLAASLTRLAVDQTGAVSVGAMAQAIVDAIAAGIAFPTPNAIADAYLNRANGVATGVTPQMAQRAQLAILSGLADGFDATSPTNDYVFRSLVGNAPAVTGTADKVGNRSARSLNLAVLADPTKW